MSIQEPKPGEIDQPTFLSSLYHAITSVDIPLEAVAVRIVGKTTNGEFIDQVYTAEAGTPTPTINSRVIEQDVYNRLIGEMVSAVFDEEPVTVGEVGSLVFL